MVHINFPTTFTEEEETLRQKYAKLRKKKKQVQAQRNVKPDREPVKENPVKRPLESAEDAKEQAKKLVKSGAIKLGDKKEKQEFKRSRNLEKKLQDPEKITASVSFTPFAAIHPEEKEEEREDRRARPSRIRGLYDTFVRGEKNAVGPERERRVDGNMRDHMKDRSDREPLPKKGNTLYVYGQGVTEELLRKHFANFGNIVNITMEKEKNCGFVTYDNAKSSDMAMQEINGAMIDSVQLRVTMARRQPAFDTTSHDASPQSWASIATNNSQKGSFKDKRDVVEYDDDIF